MPLNLEPKSSEDFVPYLKFNGKAGRWYTRNDTGQDIEILSLTAIFDLAHIKTGWILFAEGQPPDTVWDNGAIPPAPTPKHKRGFAVNVFSPKLIGGLRELSSTSNGAIIAIKDLYDQYEKQYDPAKHLVPVVTCESVKAVKSKFGTNYEPVLKIVKWVPRPHDLTDAEPAMTPRDDFDDDIPLPPPSASTPQQRAEQVDEF